MSKFSYLIDALGKLVKYLQIVFLHIRCYLQNNFSQNLVNCSFIVVKLFESQNVAIGINFKSGDFISVIFCEFQGLKDGVKLCFREFNAFT